MKVLHVAPALSGPIGGVPRSARNLCSALSAAGCENTLVSVGENCRSDIGSLNEILYRNSFTRTPILQKLYFSETMNRDLPFQLRKANAIHSHGLWIMPSLYAGKLSLNHNVPHIISPRGMLSKEALRFSRIRKSVIWKIAQHKYLIKASCLHATSYQEYQDFRSLGLKNPIALIPNSVPIHPLHRAKKQLNKEKYLLFLGRRHPIKGLDLLIAVWARLEKSFPDWTLVLAGPAEGRHDASLKSQVSKLSCERVIFKDSVEGQNKDEILRKAELLILPSKSENFGLTVAEALVQETPVLASTGTPWSGLEKQDCGWWFDRNENALEAALCEAMQLSCEARVKMGIRGRKWITNEFGPIATSRKMIEVYSWLSGLRPVRPEHVTLN